MSRKRERPEPAGRGLSRATSAALLLALLGALIIPAHGATSAERERELAQVRARMEALRHSLESARGRQSGLRAQLEQSEQAIGKLAARIAELERETSSTQSRLEELDRKRGREQQALVAERDALSRELRASYMAGRSEYLKLLLNQEDPARLGRMLTYYRYLGRARQARMAELQAILKELDRLEEEIGAQTLVLRQLRSELEGQRAAMVRKQEQRRQVLASLGKEIRSGNAELKGLQEDEKRLQKLLEALRRALADIPAGLDAEQPLAKLRGKLPWPAKGQLLARFGSDRGVGELKWNGLLIGAGEGEPVRAVYHGRVAFADWLRGFGQLLIVDHGDGYMSLYGYNQSLLKQVGDWVEPGQTLATVGRSGGRANPALYFELRHNGRPTDPLPWLARR